MMPAMRWNGEVGVAAAVLALAAFVGYETFSITVSPGYARVGPRVVPFAVTGLLTVLGIALLVSALTGRWRVEAEPGRRLLPPVLILGALAAYILLLKTAGFILASTLLFVGVAKAFGSTRILRDSAIGITMSIAVFLLFTGLLQLPLPVGTIWPGP